MSYLTRINQIEKSLASISKAGGSGSVVIFCPEHDSEDDIKQRALKVNSGLGGIVIAIPSRFENCVRTEGQFDQSVR